MKKKKILSVCLAGTMLGSSLAGTASAVDVSTFKDVEKTDWYYQYVDFVTGKDYMIGVSADRFAPEDYMTRAMFVTLLARIDGGKPSDKAPSFDDVPAGTWYTDSVKWAAENEIINGIGNNKFNPEAQIDRQQMCVIMARYIDYYAKAKNKTFAKKEVEKEFTDLAQISEYALEGVKNCQAWGLVEGNEKGAFMPSATATRAEVATMVTRLIDFLATGTSAGGGGGGGGGGGTGETAVNYVMKVSLTGTSDAVGGRTALFQTPVYSVTSTSDKVLSEVANALVAGENLTMLNNSISEAMNGVLDEDKTFTKEVNGQKVEITITTDGVIKMYTAMSMADFTKTGGDVGTQATVSQADLEALVEKLQSAQAGGSLTLTQTDRDALDELVSKATEVVETWTDQDIQDKIDEYVADKPELEQVVAGMKPDAIKEAVNSYKEELVIIQEQVKDTPVGEEVQIEVAQPVTMMVQFDLGEYYDQAVTKYEDENTLADVIAKVESKLGITLTEAEKAEIEKIYDLNNPAKLITKVGDKTLKLKTSSDYANLVAANVAAGANFWTVLDEDAEFYQDYLDKLENKDLTSYGVSYTFGDGAVDMLAGGGVFYGKEDSTVLTVEGTLDDTTYGSIADKLYDMLTNSGRSSIADMIPMGAAPDILSALLGDYTLTVTIDKQ